MTCSASRRRKAFWDHNNCQVSGCQTIFDKKTKKKKKEKEKSPVSVENDFSAQIFSHDQAFSILLIFLLNYESASDELLISYATMLSLFSPLILGLITKISLVVF